MKSQIQNLLKITPDQIRFSIFIALAISISILAVRLINLSYAGYATEPFLRLETSSKPFYFALIGTPNAFRFIFTNHILQYYALPGLLPLFFLLSRYRFLINDFRGRVASFFLAITSVLTLTHFALYHSELGSGYWENPLLKIILLILSVPALIYYVMLFFGGLIVYSNHRISWEEVQSNLKKHLLRYLIIFLILLTAFKAYFDLGTELLRYWDSLYLLLLLSLPAILVSFLAALYFFQSLSGQNNLSGLRFQPCLFAILIIYSASTVVFGILHSILSQESAGILLLVLHLMLFYLVYSVFSSYALVITQNAGTSE